MQFSFNPLLALSFAGFAIIFSTANPVITHIPIPISSPTTSSFLPPTPLPTLGTSVNATSTSLIATTTPNLGIPLHPSTIEDKAPKTPPQPNGGGVCEYPHFFHSLENPPSFDIYQSSGTYIIEKKKQKKTSGWEMMKHVNWFVNIFYVCLFRSFWTSWC